VDFLSVIGTRPQYIKFAAIQRAFRKRSIEHDYIDSGQHYNPELSAGIVSDLGLLPALKVLNPGTGHPLAQISNLLVQLDETLDKYQPRIVLVYGDTNTTLAAALSCVKKDIKFCHIEAGLRSYNGSNQEERNRILVDHSADILFAPTENSVQNLKFEGLENRTCYVGDVMVDILLQGEPYNFPAHSTSMKLKQGEYFVATFHRAENVDSEVNLRRTVKALSQVQGKIVLFAHPRLVKQMAIFGISFPKNVTVLTPVTHSQILSWIKHSNGLITDSGGLQKEAFILRVPCVTMRAETEWPETLVNGWNMLIPDLEDLGVALNRKPKEIYVNPFGDGQAGLKIVDKLQNFLSEIG
jgi:UDP-N-acetylglucosamine 2-epimerase (non-hydrolysing)